MRRIIQILAIATWHLTAHPAMAQAAGDAAPAAVRTDTPSGFPVPRFVSLKSDETFCRTGPSFRHPVEVTYLRAGLPVRVVAETIDHWRKIQDHEGKECWAHQTTLRAVSHVLVDRPIDLRVRPSDQAPVCARFEAGVLGEIEGRKGGWVRISADGVEGWAPVEFLWGAD